MMRVRGVVLLAALLLALPAAAKPPRHHRVAHARPKPAAHRKARATRSVARSAHRAPVDPEMPSGDALWETGGAYNTPQNADAQALVDKGKLPPFYDPRDLLLPPVLDAPSAVLVDAETGRVLWGKNASQRRFPASTTKILTSLLFIEHTRPNDIVTCTDTKITQIEPSSLNIKPWEKFTAQSLLYGTLLRSGNDGAVVMAEHVAGGVTKFAELMNARAVQLGATDSHWVTPNGLHDPRHYTTARDMARIACAAMENERFADAVSQPERAIERSINVHDSLIITRAHKYWERFPGADGVKTGYTHQAGHCFVGSASRAGRRLLVVVFDAKKSAVDDAVPILSWGFARWGQLTVVTHGQPQSDVAIKDGGGYRVPTVAATDLKIPSDTLNPAKPSEVTTQVSPIPVHLPIHKGDAVGQLIAYRNGKPVGSTPLLASEDAHRTLLADVGGSPMRHALLPMGGLALLLVAWRWHYATTTAKSARRRRSRLAAQSRGDDRSG